MTVEFIEGTFEWAIDQIKQGNDVHRASDITNSFYMSIRNNLFLYKEIDNSVVNIDKDSESRFSSEDIYATDWELVT